MPAEPADAEGLLVERAVRGDYQAREQLLAGNRARLRQMVAVRLDRRVSPRVDPSDVVQDALAEAARKLPDYLKEQPVPFYPWLRRIAWEHLAKAHRRHLGTKKRSIAREVAGEGALPDESVLLLAARLVDPGDSPSAHLAREELCARVQGALARLAEYDREVLALRYLEDLSIREMAAILGISEGAVKMRHLRALERLRPLLSDAEGGR
jgi:RNA polymerase sigma-70 factor (ECF subfamily)